MGGLRQVVKKTWGGEMSEEVSGGFPFLDDFLQRNTFNTPGHLSKCRSRRANHKMGVMYRACGSVCVCV